TFLVSSTIARSCHTAPAPSATSTLSLHDALPICCSPLVLDCTSCIQRSHCISLTCRSKSCNNLTGGRIFHIKGCAVLRIYPLARSEEHTSELQSRFDLVCRLMLEKKKNHTASDTS